MPNTLRIKRRASGSVGAPTSLANAELAFNEVDNTLYYGKGANGAGGTATTVEAIGGSGAFATITSAQTISGVKTFSALPAISASLGTGDNSTNVATTSFVKSQGYLTSGSGIASAASQDATIGGTIGAVTVALKSVGTSGTYTKITTDAQGRVSSGTTLAASDIPSLTAAKISDFDAQVRTSRLEQMATPTAPVAFGSQRITGLADPSSAQDAATKNYVDNISAGLDPKASCRVATTANITLSGTQTIDGIAVIAGDRVLVKNQTTGSQNGIYVVAAGAWARATDANISAEVTSGMFTFVEEGATGASNGYVLSTANPITLDTTALVFVQFSGAGQVLAGTGLTKSGNTLSIDTGYVGQTSITTLGTVGTGTWNATTIALAKGGTGAVDAAGARTNLGLGGLATQDAGGVAISGGAINGTVIGGTTPANGTFTNATVSNVLTLNSGGSGFLDGNVRVSGNPWASGGGCFRFSSNAAAPAPTAFDQGKFYWTGTALGIVDSSGVIKTFVYTDGNITGNAGTVTNGVYTNVAYVDPSFINSLSKSKVGLGNVENTALSTWAGSANITTLGTISSGTVPVARVSGLATSATTDTTNASNISSGTLADGRIAAALTGKTYNALSLTAAATGFTVAGGTTSKTLTVSNTITLAGTDASTLNIGAGGTLGTAAFTASTAYATSAQGTKADNVGAVSGIVKSNGSASFSAAVAGTDYLSPSNDIDGGTF